MRTGTVLPSSQQQYPNEDFVKMRSRISLRDVIWYRKAQLWNGKVLEATPIFKRIIEPPPSDSPQELEDIARSSVLDSWFRKLRNKTSVRRVHGKSDPQETNARPCRMPLNAPKVPHRMKKGSTSSHQIFPPSKTPTSEISRANIAPGA